MKKASLPLRIFAIMTVLASLFMLLLGAIVSKTESGEGCGTSWPFCHGQLIPESLPLETVIEYSHRINSASVGLFIVILAFWAWRKFRDNFHVKLFGSLSVFFVVFQGILGALTVTVRGLFAEDFWLALHFGFSLISFASVVLLTVAIFQQHKSENSLLVRRQEVGKSVTWFVWGLTIYTYVVVYTGALVRHAEATMGCGYAFPSCGTTIFPDLISPAGIHMLHRYTAILLWVLTVVFLVWINRSLKERKDLVRGAWLAVLLITLQAITGIITIKMGGQLVPALTHTIIISVYFSVLCYLCLQVGLPWKKKQNSTDVSQKPATVS